MKNIVTATILSVALGMFPVLAQEKKEMPMKGEAMKGGGMMMGKMKDMQGRMGEMRKGMGGMVKGDDMQGMGKMMGDMGGMMGDMGQMIGGGKMTPEEMGNMSKMMGDMSSMVTQMSSAWERESEKRNKETWVFARSRYPSPVRLRDEIGEEEFEAGNEPGLIP